MVGEQHRLGTLKVSVAWHQCRSVLLSEFQQRLLHSPQPRNRLLDDLSGVESHVQGNLIIAGAAGVQPTAHRSHQLSEAPFNVHVQVFQRRVPGKLADLNLAFHRLKAGDYGLSIFGGNYSLPAKHSRVGDGTRNIVAIQAAIIVDGDGVIAIVSHLAPCLCNTKINKWSPPKGGLQYSTEEIPGGPYLPDAALRKA